jgi:hypothetical protein
MIVAAARLTIPLKLHMKQNAHDRMKDPFFGYLMAVIEKVIVQADTEAMERSRKFTDSQIRSTLIKAIKTAKGEKPAIPAGSEHDKLLADLIPRILRKREDILTRIVDEDNNEHAEDNERPDEPVQLSHWILAMETVVSSIRIRTQMTPGSRGYLDFIHDFVKTMPAAMVTKV